MNKLDKEFLESMESLPPLAIKHFKAFLDFYKLNLKNKKGFCDDDLDKFVYFSFLDLNVTVLCSLFYSSNDDTKILNVLNGVCESTKERVLYILKEMKDKD